MTMIHRLVVCALLSAVGLAVTAQPAKKVPRIGYLAAVSATELHADARTAAVFAFSM